MEFYSVNGQRGNVRKTDMKNQLFALLKWFYMIYLFIFITVEAFNLRLL